LRPRLEVDKNTELKSSVRYDGRETNSAGGMGLIGKYASP